jgi:hypothetical protein
MTTTTLKPKTKITYKGNHVRMVISCEYPAGTDKNTADAVWAIVSNFTDIKVIFPTILRNYITYPDGTDKQLHTIRDMTFAGDPLSIGIEQLVRLNDKKRILAYVSLGGLPVTNYRAVMRVKGDNACTLSWSVNYDQETVDKGFAKILAGIFAGGEKQIGTVVLS